MAMVMATAMDTIISSHQMISQAMEITEITEITEIMEIMDSMVIQATDPKMTSNQTTNTYLHRPIHLNRSHQDPITSTFHHHKMEIAQMEMATVISIHKADIDTKATTKFPRFSTN